MNAQIKYITASAGTGKTHTLVEEMATALLSQRCAPSGLIATTYTRQAADELKRKLSSRLNEAGRNDLATQLDGALIGTVHGVCRKLLQRFAFAAGLSPSARVLDQAESWRLLDAAIDGIVVPSEVARIQTLGNRLNQKAYQQPYLWRRQLHTVVELARANNIDAGKLAAQANQSAASYLDLYPEVLPDIEVHIQEIIGVALQTLPAENDSTRVTASYIHRLHEFVARLNRDDWQWNDWIELAKATPGVRSRSSARCVQLMAERFVCHPLFHKDIRDYITGIFDLAAKVLDEFQSAKRQQGLLDFGDLEKWTLDLLKQDLEVRDQCSAQFRLLMVDEFQDTSPIQLALIMELAELAGEAVYVGDSKQSIYGFRGGDARLVNATVDELRRAGSRIGNLTQSWRSTPELVKLVNQVFGKPFGEHGAQAAFELTATRDSLQHPQPVLEHVIASSGKNRWDGSPVIPKKTEYAAALANYIASLLTDKGRRVRDPVSECDRRLRPGDVAILCQSNQCVQEVAAALRHRRISVRQSQPGLMATPEIRLTLACLRVALDSEDSLARSELLFLAAGWSREDILQNRIRFMQRKVPADGELWANEIPVLQKLDNMRKRTAGHSLAEILNEILELGEVWRTVSAWGPCSDGAAQRRANIEELLSIATGYSERCTNTGYAESACGFLQWCRDLSDDGQDFVAIADDTDGVQLLTYHSAKGLEWPVVVCTQLDTRVRERWSEPTAVPSGRAPFKLSDPLLNREIRFWPSPFGDRDPKFAPYRTLMEQEAMISVNEQTREEALRLLYVGFSRARDLLVLVEREGVPMRWLEQAGVTVPSIADGKLNFADGSSIASRITKVLPENSVPTRNTSSPLLWFRNAVKPTPKLRARIAPSEQPVTDAYQIAEIIEYSDPLTLTGTFDPLVLGQALHEVIAVDMLDPIDKQRDVITARILTNHQLDGVLDVNQAVANLTSFHQFLRRHFRPLGVYVETPFSFANSQGQIVSGYIDLCLKTHRGNVIIDHKTLTGPRSELPAKSLQHAGQLECYREAVSTAGQTVSGTWIHSPVSGAMLRVESTQATSKLTAQAIF